MPIEYTDHRTSKKHAVPTQAELKEQLHFAISEGERQAYYRNYLRRNNLILNDVTRYVHKKSGYQDLLTFVLDGAAPSLDCDKDDVTGQLIHALIERLEMCSPTMEMIDTNSLNPDSI